MHINLSIVFLQGVISIILKNMSKKSAYKEERNSIFLSAIFDLGYKNGQVGTEGKEYG